MDTYDVAAPARRLAPLQFDETKQAQLYRSPHRYIWPAELDLMAQLAGFELETRQADWAGAEFTAESRFSRVGLPHPAGPLTLPEPADAILTQTTNGSDSLGVRAVRPITLRASSAAQDQLGAGIVAEDIGAHNVTVVSDPLPDPSA